MSFCRWGEADVYLFDHVYDGLVCCACPFMELFNDTDALFPPDFAAGYDYDLYLEHIAEHQKLGHYVPDDAIETIERERAAIRAEAASNEQPTPTNEGTP
jgi:hypothetical protein